MVSVATQQAFRQLNILQGQGSQAFLHHCIALEQANQFGTGAIDVSERIKQIKHATAFSQQWFAGCVVSADGVQHRGIFR